MFVLRGRSRSRSHVRSRDSRELLSQDVCHDHCSTRHSDSSITSRQHLCRQLHHHHFNTCLQSMSGTFSKFSHSLLLADRVSLLYCGNKVDCWGQLTLMIIGKLIIFLSLLTGAVCSCILMTNLDQLTLSTSKLSKIGCFGGKHCPGVLCLCKILG